jgi:hypothetical protein
LLTPADTEPRASIKAAFSNMLATTEGELQAFRFLKRNLPLLFTSRVEEYNAIFGQQQIENIYFTLSLIDNYKYKQDKVDALIKANVQKCVLWCIKYGVFYHSLFVSGDSCAADRRAV